MKTRDSLSGLNNLLDNISFERNPNVERACDALMQADQEFRPFFGILRGYTSGLDEDNGYVMIFLPLYDLQKETDEELNRFYEILRKRFLESNFEILYECDIDGDVYFHVGFASHNYILKSLI